MVNLHRIDAGLSEAHILKTRRSTDLARQVAFCAAVALIVLPPAMLRSGRELQERGAVA
jgi:hypothetical protein